jgi:hypothetical protein
VKHTKLFRILATGVVLSLLVAVIPASPALAAQEIEVDPDEGRIGDEFDVTGYDFQESYYDTEYGWVYNYADIYFVWYDEDEIDGADDLVGWDLNDEVNTYESLGNSRTDEYGDFEETDLEVPDRLRDGDEDEDVRGGTYYICATFGDFTRIRAAAEFNVIAGELDPIDPDSGPVGTKVDITGDNFAENEDITVKYDGSDITDDVIGDASSDRRGDIDFSIVIPSSTAGEHTVTVSDESLSDADVTFTVEPEMSFTPSQAPPEGTVTVTGTGYGDRVDVDIFLGGVAVTSGETDSDGEFSIDFTVPEMDEGTYELLAEDEDGNDDVADFTVLVGTELSVTPVTSSASPGYVGQSVTVSGTGFKANSTVTITYTSEPQVVATLESDAEGDFSATFNIPASEGGAHTITASDGTNSLQFAFYMERQAPDIPQPLLPEMGVKASSKTFFEWESVDDPSGVTYELQVATSEDFSAGSMMVELLGLTESEYTLTPEQALPSRSAEEPYYWRVRAVDGAGNASGWTLGEFSVGFAFPDWIIHLWWGLGVIGAIFLGYYLGKRRAYYY